jgi:hypothetical protein
MPSILTKNLLASLSRRATIAVAVATILVGGGVGALLAAQGGALTILGVAIALIAGVVALRIAGPQDAKSFRLYRSGKA